MQQARATNSAEKQKMPFVAHRDRDVAQAMAFVETCEQSQVLGLLWNTRWEPLASSLQLWRLDVRLRPQMMKKWVRVPSIRLHILVRTWAWRGVCLWQQLAPPG